MSVNSDGQPPNPINSPFSYEHFNQGSQASKSVWGLSKANPSSLEREGSGVPGDSSQKPFNFKPGSISEDGGSAAAVAAQNSLSSAIASTSTNAPDNASLIAPAAFLNALPSSASRPLSGSVAIKPSTGSNNAPPFAQNQPRHGDILPGAPHGGYDDLPPSIRPAQQHTSPLLPRATAAATSSVHLASATPANHLGSPANGISRPDASSGNSLAVVNKPVLKMKRTGQNFPLSSGTALLHQRKHSYSPGQKQGSLPGNATAKASGPLTKPGQEPVSNEKPKPPIVRPSEKPGASSKVESQQVLRFTEHSAPNESLSNSARHPTNGRSGGKTTATIQDSDTDDIIYETAVQTEPFDDSGQDAVDNESSSDDSDSQSDDDDETVDMDAGEAPLRQLFRAPDQEDEHDNSEEEVEEDDATSESSSDDSSIANEPAVALPSAKIQHQETYPSTILEMAEPGRLYTECRHKGVAVKAGPALFPVGYSKSTTPGFPWVCAVRSCRLLYKTPAGLANHARFTHKKAMFNDNMDGTVSLVGSYSRKSQSGHYPPVVVSKRPLDPKEPPIREPSFPVKKHSKKVRSDATKMSASLILDGDDAVMGDGYADNLEPQEDSPPPTADLRSSEKMWEYVRPFLSVHKALPETNWARHVIHLPRVRDIQWNEERNKEHPYKDSHPRDVTALIVQVTGVESPAPCDACVRGRGPFIGCIVISPKASNDAKGAVLSCANCYYHCGQSSCSLCKDAVARRARQTRGGQKPGSYNVKLLSDAAHRKSAKDKVDQPQALSASMASLEAPARPNLKLYQPSDFKSIENASSERTYKVIKGLNGKDVLMCGALIPEKYDLDRTVPSYPWICPIRSCRKVFKKIASLGSHSVKAHNGCLLNDNQDGTLSQIGYYETPQPGNTGLPALVISKNPLDPKEPPMETPGLPGQGVHASKVHKHKIIIKEPQGASQIQPGQLTTSNAKELWNYMLRYLPESLNSIASEPRILGLFNLPRRREIQWRMNRQIVRVDDDKRQILGLVIYLTGEKHKNGERSCTHCVRRNGPFPDCLTLTSGVPEDAQFMVQSCANCVFTHKSSSCSIKSSWSKEADERSHYEAAAKKRVRVSDDDSEEPAATRRRSDRLGLEDEEHRLESKKKIVTWFLKRNDQTSSSSGAGKMSVQTRAVSNGGVAKGEPSSALIHAGQIQPDELMEMEDWEIAPGRIRGAGADGVNSNIAYSKSYLEANQAVRVSRDVTFEVKSIKSGHNLELEADRKKTRYCTLASGKLYVNVEEQEPFTIGPHGLFKIAPGSAAKIQNRLYIDSVLHISTYADG